MIDACVATKVAVNWKNAKNKLGAFYEPDSTLIDFTLLQTLPSCEVRNGMAEIIKVAACTQLSTFNLLEEYGKRLLDARFGNTGYDNDVLGQIGSTVLTESKIEVLSILTNPQ